MNASVRLAVLAVTVFLLVSSTEVQCRRTYSSRSSSSGRGNRGKNQPSSGGLFSSWFGGSKSSSSSGAVVKPVPTSSKKNWQTAAGQATAQSKPASNWANPYYKPASGANVPSAPREPAYGWKPAGASNPSANIGPRGYPVQPPSHHGSPGTHAGYKPASAPSISHAVPPGNQNPSQTNFGAYRPSSGVPNVYATGQLPSGRAAPNLHSGQASHAYQSSHHPSAAYPQQPAASFSGYHPSYSGYSPHSSFGGAVPTYQGSKLFGGSTGHYGYPGGGSWGIDTYGSRKSSGTGKLLTGLAVGAAGGYLTSSLVNSLSNPWKYSGYGYGSGFTYGSGYGPGYGPGYDYGRSRDESAFERGFERGVQSRQQNENANNRDTAAPTPPEDPTAKWVQCVAFDPQTQQTLINPNCSCTVTTTVDERTGQPLSAHHCTTLNGLVMRPVPIHSEQPLSLPPSLSVAQAAVGPRAPDAAGNVGPMATYGGAYQGEFQYNGGPTVYLPPLKEPGAERPALESTGPEQSPKEAALEKTAKIEPSTTETVSSAAPTEQVTEKAAEATSEAAGEGRPSPTSEKSAGGLQENRERTAEFYGRLQKIVNMGNFLDGR